LRKPASWFPFSVTSVFLPVTSVATKVKAYGKSRNIAALTLNLDKTPRRWLVSFTPWERFPRTQRTRWLCLRDGLGSSGRRRHCLSVPRI